MSKEKIQKEIEKLQRTVKSGPRIWKFRGRRVVKAQEWKWADWTKLPDSYNLLVIWNNKGGMPEDWLRDYTDLLEKTNDPVYGKYLCMLCIVDQAQDAKREVNRLKTYWGQRGGEAGRQKDYEERGEPSKSYFLKEDAVLQVKLGAFTKLAEGRTCQVINYFQCPYGNKRDKLLRTGSFAKEFWDHIEWYDHHWYPSFSSQPKPSEMKWYHYDEKPIIDITNSDDVAKSLEDGRYDRIVKEHISYMKETEREIRG
jgi:hypothetical protein